MSRQALVDLIVEDRAHEEFVTRIVERIARGENVPVDVRVRWARGGRGRVISEFKLYQQLVEKGATGALVGANPSVLVVSTDCNCSTLARKRQEIQAAATPTFVNHLVAACPDPHIERWYLSDPDSFHKVVGYQPVVGRKKCARDYYKGMLTDAVRQAGYPPTLGGIEFAKELVEAMDLYRAGRNDRSLGAFVDDLRGKLKLLRAQ